MDTQNGEYSVQNDFTQNNSEEAAKVKTSLEKADKNIKSAAGLSAAVAFINILLGAAIVVFPNLLSGEALFDPANGIGYLIFGLLYLGLSIGIGRRSRICVIIALAVFAVDAALTLTSGLAATSIAGYAMKVLILVGLFCGITGCFKYHSIKSKYANTTDAEISGFIESTKPKTKASQIVVYVILALIGIGAAVYGFMGGANSGKNFDDWVSYSSGAVTVKMPSERVEKTTEAIPDLPGVTYLTAQSDSTTCSVVLLTYRDFYKVVGHDIDTAEVEKSILDAFADELDCTVTDRSEGSMGAVDYMDMSITFEGCPGVLRCFSGENDIYVVGVMMSKNVDKDDLIGQCLNSIEIK